MNDTEYTVVVKILLRNVIVDLKMEKIESMFMMTFSDYFRI
jgi:hypothetical protein